MKSAASKASRRQREVERHRAEIMSAAEQLFAKKGYVSSSMDEVARLAEFSVGTLYNFFENKEDLYAAIMRQKTDMMQVRIVECLARKGTAAQRIRAYFQERLDLYWRYPNFFRLFFHQTMSSVSDPRTGFMKDLAERYEVLLKGLEAIFESGIKRGEFRNVPASILTISLEAIIRGYLVRLSLQPAPVRSREQETALYEFFESGAVSRAAADGSGANAA